MQLVEKHIINKNSEFYSECDELCFKSKNLYNYANYVVRQEFIRTSKEKELGLRTFTNYLNYNAINRILIDENQFDMYQLPIKVSNQTLMVLDKNWKSFFKSIKDYSKNKSKYNGKPSLPKYLDKEKGRFVAIYEKGAISKKRLKYGIVKLSKTNIEISSKKENINMVRIVPRLDHYVIEIVYTVPDVPKLENNDKYFSLDLGVNNLAAITSNVKEIKPIIINGKPLKSINQFYNRKVAEYKSILEIRNKKKSSKNLRKITNKRNRKVDDYLQKASKLIVDLSIEKQVNTIVIGKNDGWKQESEMSKKNNQNFVNIPHSRFINMIVYKCEKQGINIILQEESYTSKASFLNLDKIPTYGKIETEPKFSGYRQCRGLYKIKGSKETINADVNGSYNILRKAVPNVFTDGIEGLSVNPTILKIVN
jgi:IS605 OrfB family transposase